MKEDINLAALELAKRTWTPQSNKSFDEIASDYGYLFDRYNGSGMLNDEVKIINDKKILQFDKEKVEIGNLLLEEKVEIPRKIETFKDRNNEIFIDELCCKYKPIHKESLTFNEQVIVDKLNEVLDYLKSKGDE